MGDPKNENPSTLPGEHHGRVSRSQNWMATWWVVALFSVLLLLGILRELLRGFTDYRSMDLLIHFSAAGLGMAIAHSWVKQSMARSRQHLGKMVGDCMKKLHAKMQDASFKGQIPLPIPYLVASLRDENSSSFGYFDGKLISRDPRLLLDLSLDEALKPDDAQMLWELTQTVKIQNARKTEEAKDTAEKHAAEGSAKQARQEPPEAAAKPGLDPAQLALFFVGLQELKTTLDQLMEKAKAAGSTSPESRKEDEPA